MTFNQPRHPIVIIGAGLAGLSAAITLQELGVPFIVLERFSRAGGRFTSRRGEGWLADHGAQYVRRSDEKLGELIRKVGFEPHRVTVQGAVHHLVSDSKVEVPPGGGFDSDRVCLDIGFGALTDALAARVEVKFNHGVSAVRWDNDEKTFWWQKEGQVFWFEDEHGEAIRHPVTREVLIGSGLILATTPTAAASIARKSPSLEELVPLLAQVSYTKCYTGIYRIPRIDNKPYALKGDASSRIAWLAFEEMKAPNRVHEEFSLMIVQASPAYSIELMAMNDNVALMNLYGTVRRLLFDLPELPITQTYKRWNIAQIDSAPLGYPEGGRWPVNPDSAPFALAGDYLLGNRAEDAVRSGEIAALQVLGQLPRRRNVLGLEIRS
jgi:predicted NAD/FAD-dependent oxidoreductase